MVCSKVLKLNIVPGLLKIVNEPHRKFQIATFLLKFYFLLFDMIWIWYYVRFWLISQIAEMGFIPSFSSKYLIWYSIIHSIMIFLHHQLKYRNFYEFVYLKILFRKILLCFIKIGLLVTFYDHSYALWRYVLCILKKVGFPSFLLT